MLTKNAIVIGVIALVITISGCLSPSQKGRKAHIIQQIAEVSQEIADLETSIGSPASYPQDLKVARASLQKAKHAVDRIHGDDWDSSIEDGITKSYEAIAQARRALTKAVKEAEAKRQVQPAKSDLKASK